MTRKATRMLGFRKGNFRHCGKVLNETLRYSFAQSTLGFVRTIGDPSAKSLFEKIEKKIQNRSARFVLRNYKMRASVKNIKKDDELGNTFL